MRKVIIVIAMLFLVACGGNSEEELNTFIESFNENTVLAITVDRIEPENIAEIENNMQLLSENKYRSKIYAKYEGDVLAGYQLEIHPEEWYDRDSMGGYDAAEVIVSTLELNKSQFETEYSKMVIGGGEHTYSDNGYDISFNYHITSEEEFKGAIIDFDKTSQ